MVQHLKRKQGARILLSPNCSLSWQGNVRIWIALCLLSLVISGGMALAGAWVILPFAGLELAALAFGFYYTSRQCRRREVLDISADCLQLEKGVYHKEAQWTLPRRDTRIHLVAPRHPWTPPKLFLLHREAEVALASFLNCEDTRILVDLLESLGMTVERHQPYQTAWF